jgi:hypothetical protein
MIDKHSSVYGDVVRVLLIVRCPEHLVPEAAVALLSPILLTWRPRTAW